MRLVLAAGVLCCCGAAAQQTVFRSFADSVALDVLVTAGNRPDPGLTAPDFEVSDNGVRQTIHDVGRETLPLDVTLVVDTSGSIHERLLASLVRAVNKVREQLRREDRVALVTFDQRIRERIPLSTATGLGAIRVEPGSGTTSLNDAVAVALTSPRQPDRRQMAIVFTDGFDTISFLGEDAVADVARRSRTAVFVVAVALRGGRLPEAFFGRIADLTGGMVQIVPPFAVAQDGSRTRITFGAPTDVLDAPFLRALEDFRTSYVVRYTPDGVPRGGWHQVDVRVTKRGGPYSVRARQGYMAGR